MTSVLRRLDGMGRRKHVKTMKPTYSGAVAAYEYAGMMRDVPGLGSMWSDSMVGTRPNGVTVGSMMPNWTGMAITMVSPSSLPPQINGVADVVGTGQPFNPGMPTLLDYRYQESVAGLPVPMEIDQGAVECWAKAIDTAGLQSMVAYHYILAIATHSGNFKYYYFDAAAGPTTQYIDRGVAVDTNWQHFFLNFDHGGTADFWIDGVKRVAGGGAPPSLSVGRAWYIGDQQIGNQPYEGLIDTVRFYNRNLTDDEITRNYWSGIGLHT